MRCDDEATGTLKARGKLVHPEFLQHIEEDGRWERNAQKNSVRLDWWWNRDNEGMLQEPEPEPAVSVAELVNENTIDRQKNGYFITIKQQPNIGGHK